MYTRLKQNPPLTRGFACPRWDSNCLPALTNTANLRKHTNFEVIRGQYCPIRGRDCGRRPHPDFRPSKPSTYDPIPKRRGAALLCPDRFGSPFNSSAILKSAHFPLYRSSARRATITAMVLNCPNLAGHAASVLWRQCTGRSSIGASHSDVPMIAGQVLRATGALAKPPAPAQQGRMPAPSPRSRESLPNKASPSGTDSSSQTKPSPRSTANPTPPSPCPSTPPRPRDQRRMHLPRQLQRTHQPNHPPPNHRPGRSDSGRRRTLM